MGNLQFSHCNIAMAINDTTGRRIVWDRDTDTFGSGYDYPEALADLAQNYGEDYRTPPGLKCVMDMDKDVSEEELERVREHFKRERDA